LTLVPFSSYTSIALVRFSPFFFLNKFLSVRFSWCCKSWQLLC
jgi:hypothetical protein